MKRIHVTLVGKETLPAYYLAKELKADIVYVLATKQSKPEASRLKRVLKDEDVKCVLNCDIDAFDINSVISACEEIQSLSDENTEVSYNLTGGTKPMAIGAYKVAEAHDARIYYTNSDRLMDWNLLTSQPLELKVDNETIFALQGQILKHINVYEEDVANVECARAIMSFLQEAGNRKVFSKLWKLYDEHQLGNSYSAESFQYKYEKGHLSIEVAGNVKLDICNDGARKLMFEGRWWETIVAQAVFEWSAGRYDVFRNVTFSPRNSESSQNDKNEVDVLVNIGNKMLFIECKSGRVTQDNINKMAVIRQNYGSDKSKSVLATLWPLPEDLKEKARESHVHLIVGTESIASRLNAIMTAIKA